MRKLFGFAVVSILGLTAMVGSAEAQGKSHLDTVLGQMDAASAKFHSAEADFQWDFYERVTKSTSTQKGITFFQREKNGSMEMGAKIVTPGVKLLSYKGGVLQVFDPGANTLLRIAAHGSETQESFLTLGFGASGQDLAKAWTIQDEGMDTVDGTSTAKLDLVSKDQSVRNMFTHVTIWVDLNRAIALKQMAYTPSDDVRTVLNKNIRYNAKVDTKPYGIKPNSNTSVTNR